MEKYKIKKFKLKPNFRFKKFNKNDFKIEKFNIRNINWKKGAAELLGYGIILPMIVVMIIAILTAGQISNVKQNLAYASYTVGRAAVVCNNTTSAQNRADAIMREMYGDKFIGGTISQDIKNDYIYQLQNGDTCYEITLVGANPRWSKGDIIECTIYQRIVPVMPFMDNIYSESLAMMIEAGGIFVGGAVDGDDTVVE